MKRLHLLVLVILLLVFSFVIACGGGGGGSGSDFDIPDDDNNPGNPDNHNSVVEVFDAFTCEGFEYGSSDKEDPHYWNLAPSEVKYIFQVGERLTFFAKAYNVPTHQFKVVVKHPDGEVVWEDIGEKQIVEEGEPWSYSPFVKEKIDLLVGNYEAFFYLDEGEGFALRGRKSFSVTDEEVTVPYTEKKWNENHRFVLVDNKYDTELKIGDEDGDRSLVVTANPLGGEHYERRMRVTGLDLIPGKFYPGNFWLSGSKDGTVTLSLDNKATFKSSGFWKDIAVTSGARVVNFIFQAPEEAESFELIFHVGEYTGELYIDDFEVYMASELNLLPLSISFITSRTGIGLNDQLLKASFFNSPDGGHDNGPYLQFKNMEKDSVNPWKVQLYMHGFDMEEGQEIAGSIWFKADHSEGQVSFSLIDVVNNFQHIGLWQELDFAVILEGEYEPGTWHQVDFEFTVEGDPKAEDIRFVIQCAGFLGELGVDDIVLQ